jgi:polyisoprenoid-binding protein YceI
MKTTWLAVTLFGIAVSTRDGSAVEPPRPIRPESRVWFTGASNIRRFTCTARRLSGTVQLRGVTTRGPVLSGENASPQPSVSVPVDRVDCGIGVMNRHLRDALRGARHPVIEFRLATYEVDLNAPVPVARIAGQVTIAGVQRPVAATAVVRADTLGALHMQGSYDIRPTEFGVAPPRRFAGLLRVRDRITVHFDVALDPDGSTIDEIRCALNKLAEAKLEPESTHASHP